MCISLLGLASSRFGMRVPRHDDFFHVYLVGRCVCFSMLGKIRFPAIHAGWPVTAPRVRPSVTGR
eukprot:5901991-Prymnesium_polylepis.1